MKQQSEMELGVKFIPPTLEAVKKEAMKMGLTEIEAVSFHAYYCAKGWKVGRVPMKSWKDALNYWRLQFEKRQQKHSVWQLKTIIEAKQKVLAALEAQQRYQTASGYRWRSELAREKHRRLRLEIEEMTEQLAEM